MQDELPDCQSLFFRGDYAAVIANYLDNPRQKLTGDHLHWVIGSLCFTGRLAEAEALYQRLTSSKNSSDVAPVEVHSACRYFLAVAHLRHNEWHAAVNYLIANLKSARLVDDETNAPLIEFYAAQGMGFTRYRTGRLKQAIYWAERAQMAAVAADFLYGRVLSGDLLGHIRVNLGQVRRGLRDFERTASLAQTLGQGAITQAIASTLAIYRSRFGVVPPAVADDDLKQQIAQCRFEDSYTLASLHLERARLARLTGQATQERIYIDAAMPLVYSVRSPHLEALLNIRLAEPLLQSGNPRQALDMIRHSLAATDRRDLTLSIKLNGIEYRALLALGKLAESEEVLRRIETLTQMTGQRLAVRILGRARGIYQADAMRGEDPLGDLLDEVHREYQKGPDRLRRASANIIASGWSGLLYRLLNVPLDKPAIAFDLEFGALTLFEQGDVIHIQDGVSSLGRKFIEALSTGPKTKEQLIASVWQLRYHPLKHDSLIYALVAKLRRTFGMRSHWVQATEDGYRLPPDILLLTALESRAQVAVTPIATLPAAAAGENHTSLPPMNTRQLEILRRLKLGEHFDIQRGMQEFNASDATISRDLAFLVNSGLAERIGKGRATKYRLKSTQNIASNDALQSDHLED